MPKERIILYKGSPGNLGKGYLLNADAETKPSTISIHSIGSGKVERSREGVSVSFAGRGLKITIPRPGERLSEIWHKIGIEHIELPSGRFVFLEDLDRVMGHLNTQPDSGYPHYPLYFSPEARQELENGIGHYLKVSGIEREEDLRMLVQHVITRLWKTH